MTQAEAGGRPREAGLAPLGDVLRVPLRDGATLGTLILAVLSAGSAYAEGGVDSDSERGRLLVQAALLFATGGVTGFYAHRIVVSTLEGDREIRWGEDPLDRTTWVQDVSHFASVVVATFLPVALAMGATQWLGLSPLSLLAPGIFGIAAASVVLPLSVVSTTLRERPFGGSWKGAWRAWNRDRAATTLVSRWAALALVLYVVSFVVAGEFVPPLESGRDEHEHVLARDAARVAVFLLRFGGIWLVLGSFRAAGVAARDREAMREVLE